MRELSNGPSFIGVPFRTSYLYSVSLLTAMAQSLLLSQIDNTTLIGLLMIKHVGLGLDESASNCIGRMHVYEYGDENIIQTYLSTGSGLIWVVSVMAWDVQLAGYGPLIRLETTLSRY
ncbi:hypothetical protein AVEN_273950-1 [Araneus ventricosus]|uniref:Uncharacterized protein n=1 Tax=Araneus ventricosus TaxID=182803 RepID=A0A4Y2HN59_ARAVE|nr:hypothetical protein AVEN_273950-1 [Araneus ventricosus]